VGVRARRGGGGGDMATDSGGLRLPAKVPLPGLGMFGSGSGGSGATPRGDTPSSSAFGAFADEEHGAPCGATRAFLSRCVCAVFAQSGWRDGRRAARSRRACGVTDGRRALARRTTC
jgi:hypothetical protein